MIKEFLKSLFTPTGCPVYEIIRYLPKPKDGVPRIEFERITEVQYG